MSVTIDGKKSDLPVKYNNDTNKTTAQDFRELIKHSKNFMNKLNLCEHKPLPLLILIPNLLGPFHTLRLNASIMSG